MLTGVTITGADDGVDPGELVELSRKFPFVEWGILASRKKEGQPRYPSTGWVGRLKLATNERQLRLALHACGAFAREIIAGEPGAMALIPWQFQRCQLNGFTAPSEALLDWMRQSPGQPEWILQVRDQASLAAACYAAGHVHEVPTLVSVLWDASGGRGIRETAWPNAADRLPISVGRAGGIGPDNVADEARSAAECPDDTWLDMESGVRTNDRFDLGKVRAVLEAAKPYVQDGR